MNEEFIGTLVIIAVGGFFAIAITALIFSWAFKVNQQIFYLRQINEQIAGLHNNYYRVNIKSLDSDKGK